MPTGQTDTHPMHDPLAELERHLIGAYVAGAGHDLDELRARTDEDARRLLAEASRLREREVERGRSGWRGACGDELGQSLHLNETRSARPGWGHAVVVAQRRHMDVGASECVEPCWATLRYVSNAEQSAEYRHGSEPAIATSARLNTK